MIIKEFYIKNKDNALFDVLKVHEVAKFTPTYVNMAKLICDITNIHKQKIEHKYILSLDSKMEPKGICLIATGTENHTIFSPDLEIAFARQTCGNYFISFHNHPNNLLYESNDDIDAVIRQENACAFSDIFFLDEIIITNKGFYSVKTKRKYLMNGE